MLHDLVWVAIPCFLGLWETVLPFTVPVMVSVMSEHMCWNQLLEDLLSLYSYPSICTKLYASNLPFPRCLYPSSRVTLAG